MRKYVSAVIFTTLLGAFQLPSVHADVLVADATVATTKGDPAPAEYSFTTTASEVLTLTLTDIQEPAAFTSLSVAVTLNDTLVGSATVDATHKATVAIPAAVGTYTVHVVGAPDSTQGFGSFGACVTRNSDPTPRTCIAADSYSGNIEIPNTPSSTPTSQVSTQFTSTTAGTYTVTLSDDAFPVALGTLSGLISNGATQTVITAGAPMQVTLTAGTQYQLLLFAQTNATVMAGLYGIKVVDPAGAVLFDRSEPVGSIAPVTEITNPKAQALTLKLQDYGYPSALSGLGAAVTLGSTPLAVQNAAGTIAIASAAAGTLELWTYAEPGSQPGVYGLSLASSSSTLYSTTQVLNPTATTTSTFAFVVQLPAAGQYNLAVSDFQFPGALQSLSSTIELGGTVLTVSSSGDFTTTQGGTAIVEVQAQAVPSGTGIFSVAVQSGGSSPTLLLDQTQGVGGVFTQRIINFGNAGQYDLTLTDLNFPQAFTTLAVVLSQGNQVLGKVYDSGSTGTFSFKLTPGQYVLSYVTEPGTQTGSLPLGYGLYGTRISSTPPTVTFSASSASVQANDTDTLTWSSTNAASCTASGGTGWSGAEATSGSLAVVVSQTETLTLACTGPGGSVTQTVTITATAPPSKSSGGGGGELGIDALALLALVTLATRARLGLRRGR
ncbi:MAG TPA: hypothetical protein VGI93_23525 [Steroidobacteraceae bacterium]|jgi:hypothetical protein